MALPLQKRAARSDGFTLVELLVVIAVIGILVALLLPTVQTARESARRTECTNHLKQIALATHLYHDLHGVLPMGHFWPESNISDDAAAESTWVMRTFPFLEQQNLYNLVDWDYGFGHADSTAGNVQFTSVQVEAFRCPSDAPASPIQFLGVDAFAKGNYVGNNGLGPMSESNLAHLPVTRPAGLLFLNSAVRIEDVRDGSSHTALLSEVVLTDAHDFRGVMHYPEGSLYHHNFTPNGRTPDEVRHSHCSSSPPAAPCLGTFSSWFNRALIYTARSRHPGGVNLALGDASVRAVSDTIDLATWQAMSTSAGGEIVVLP